MHEQLPLNKRKFNVENDTRQEDIEHLRNIVENFDNAEIDDIYDLYTLGEIKTIRHSLSILFPEEKFNSDPKIYRALAEESLSYIERGDLERYVSNAIYLKTIFPEKARKLNKDLNNMKVYPEIISLLTNASYGDDVLEAYNYAAKAKKLFPNDFEQLDLLRILQNNAWEENIQKTIQSLTTLDEVTDFLCNLKIVQFPSEAQINDNNWIILKAHAEELRKDEDYTIFAEYISKLHILSAKDIEIDEDKLSLIF